MSKVNSTSKGAVKVKKSTKGIPRVNAGVLVAGPKQDAFKAKVATLPASVQAEINARFNAALIAGPKVKVSSTARLEKTVAKLTVKADEINAKLVVAQENLKAAQEKEALDKVSGIKKLEKEISDKQAEMAALMARIAAKESKPVVQA